MRLSLVVALLALLALSCGAPSTDGVVVGTFAVEEAELLAGVVAAAVGGDSRVDASFGTRADLLAALDEGSVDVVVDYLGSLLDHLGVPGDAQGPDPAATLADLLPGYEVVVAPGHAGRGLVVTSEFAGRRGLRSVSGLEDLAGGMVVGGPADCPRSSTCLAGLATVYGFAFGGFVPIDDEELLAASLEAGDLDAAVLFVTDPVLDRRRLVALDDDLGMHVLEAPVVIAGEGALGAVSLDAVEAVFARLDTEAILGLNLRAEAVGADRAIDAFVGG